MTDTCVLCKRELGDAAKIQPTTIDGERFCPRCFVARRVYAEPERMTAHQSCAAKCTNCEWETLCFGAVPGRSRLHCNHCGRDAALKVPLQAMPFSNAEKSTIEQIARASGMREPARIARK